MNLANAEYCIGRGVAAVRGMLSVSGTSYLYYWLNKEAPSILALATAGGSTFPNITKSQMNSLSFPLPPISEQDEIAYALDATDRKIAVEEQRKSALEALFHSTLQQLMTGQIRINAETQRRGGTQRAFDDAFASLRPCVKTRVTVSHLSEKRDIQKTLFHSTLQQLMTGQIRLKENLR